MIIDARDDVVTLSGPLERNVWPAIESAANLLLREHPRGILIDANGINACSHEGVKTFVDAMSYIERYKARIVLCYVPECVLGTIKSVPGARSRVAMAATLEEGRASLDLARAQRESDRKSRRRGEDTGGKPRAILVPLLPIMTSTREAIGLAVQLGTVIADSGEVDGKGNAHPRKIKPVLHLDYILTVPRSLPLTSPFPEEETKGRTLIAEAQALTAKKGLMIATDVVRARDAAEEILERAKDIQAEMIIMALPLQPEGEREAIREMIGAIIEHAPCEVIIKRATATLPPLPDAPVGIPSEAQTIHG